jgi:hypothetical protein
VGSTTNRRVSPVFVALMPRPTVPRAVDVDAPALQVDVLVLPAKDPELAVAREEVDGDGLRAPVDDEEAARSHALGRLEHLRVCRELEQKVRLLYSCESVIPHARCPIHRGLEPFSSMTLQEEIVVPLSAPRERIQPISQIRSTLLTSSLKSIYDRDLGDRYFALLPARYHGAVRACIAGVWLPIDLGLAHYEACDALALSEQEQLAIGQEVGMKIQGTFLGTMLKLTKAAGVTPWLPLAQYQRLWDRLMVGGGVIVTRLGPKEARLEFVNVQLARVPYFRTAFRGVNLAGSELFCKKGYAEEIKKLCSPVSLGFRLSWV